MDNVQIRNLGMSVVVLDLGHARLRQTRHGYSVIRQEVNLLLAVDALRDAVLEVTTTLEFGTVASGCVCTGRSGSGSYDCPSDEANSDGWGWARLDEGEEDNSGD